MFILGAGLAGCIAGIINPSAIVIEASTEFKRPQHRAVLRFRSNEIGKAVGIPFKQVTVRKGIWTGSNFVRPDIRFANQYSAKCNGKILDRSIWNLDTAVRYVAPDDLHLRLIEKLGVRIWWGTKVGYIDDSFIHAGASRFDRSINAIVSTLPMHILASITNHELSFDSSFQHKKIIVHRFHVPDCAVYQTIYYPEPDLPVYRATLTGEDLIVESVDDIDPDGIEIGEVCYSFGMKRNQMQFLERQDQKYGKIAPVDERVRRQFILDMTMRLRIYSLGRFGTWRNILLDDVYDDIAAIERLINSDGYFAKLYDAR
jgi:hypothetical protein